MKLPWDPAELRASLRQGPEPIQVRGVTYLCYAELNMHRGVFIGVRDDSDRTFTIDPLTATVEEIPPGSGLLAISAHYVKAAQLLLRMRRCEKPEPRVAVQQMFLAGIARPDTFGEELRALLEPYLDLPEATTLSKNVQEFSTTFTSSSPRMQSVFADALTFLLRPRPTTE